MITVAKLLLSTSIILSPFYQNVAKFCQYKCWRAQACYLEHKQNILKLESFPESFPFDKIIDIRMSGDFIMATVQHNEERFVLVYEYMLHNKEYSLIMKIKHKK